eukprot:TRINITY_DN2656_c0_g1_i1.p1 TRINITY_DN2656_c0_g1~~TRINITY_DN2656_c0_g1_i1.p1  ORF type:complete len:1182 (+),score=263.23 TRINITY_DN2656_c0_g1_i1:182-3727(+)
MAGAVEPRPSLPSSPVRTSEVGLPRGHTQPQVGGDSELSQSVHATSQSQSLQRDNTASGSHQGAVSPTWRVLGASNGPHPSATPPTSQFDPGDLGVRMQALELQVNRLSVLIEENLANQSFVGSGSIPSAGLEDSTNPLAGRKGASSLWCATMRGTGVGSGGRAGTPPMQQARRGSQRWRALAESHRSSGVESSGIRGRMGPPGLSQSNLFQEKAGPGPSASPMFGGAPASGAFSMHSQQDKASPMFSQVASSLAQTLQRSPKKKGHTSRRLPPRACTVDAESVVSGTPRNSQFSISGLGSPPAPAIPGCSDPDALGTPPLQSAAVRQLPPAERPSPPWPRAASGGGDSPAAEDDGAGDVGNSMSRPDSTFGGEAGGENAELPNLLPASGSQRHHDDTGDDGGERAGTEVQGTRPQLEDGTPVHLRPDEEAESSDWEEAGNYFDDEPDVFVLLPDSGLRRLTDAVFSVFALCEYFVVTLNFVADWDKNRRLEGVHRLTATEITVLAVTSALHCFVMVVNFRTAFLQGWELVGDEQEELPDVWRYYLRSWFSFDLLYSVPWDLSLGFVSREVQYISFLRLLSVARVPFLFKSSSPLVTNRPMAVKGFLFFFYIAVGLHLLACVWMLAGGFTAGQDDDDGSNDSLSTRYLKGLYWAITTMTTVGYGDIVPTSDEARLLSAVAMLIGAGLFAYIMGNISTLLINEDPFQSRMREKKKNLAALFKHYEIPISLQKETFLVFPTIIDRVLTQTEDTLGALPPHMQERLTHQIKLRIVIGVPLFRGASRKVLSMLAARFTQHLVSSGVYVLRQGEPGEELFILNKGIVDVYINDPENGQEKRVGSIRMGKWFGEIALIKHCTRTASIKTSTACELFVLHRDDFRKVARIYPEFERRLFESTSQHQKDNAPSEQSSETQVPSARHTPNAPAHGAADNRANILANSVVLTPGSNDRAELLHGGSGHTLAGGFRPRQGTAATGMPSPRSPATASGAAPSPNTRTLAVDSDELRRASSSGLCGASLAVQIADGRRRSRSVRTRSTEGDKDRLEKLDSVVEPSSPLVPPSISSRQGSALIQEEGDGEHRRSTFGGTTLPVGRNKLEASDDNLDGRFRSGLAPPQEEGRRPSLAATLKDQRVRSKARLGKGDFDAVVFGKVEGQLETFNRAGDQHTINRPRGGLTDPKSDRYS